MTDQNQSHDEDVEAPPTWAVMRRDGLMLVDDKYDKLAVYVGGDEGHVVIMSQGMVGDEPHFHTVHCTVVEKLIAALKGVLPLAQEDQRIFEEKCEQAARDAEILESKGEAA